MIHRLRRVKIDMVLAGPHCLEEDMESQRLFVAIDLPQDVKAALREVQQQLRHAPLAVRWADPSGTHLTLKFLGSTDPVLLPRIQEGLSTAVEGISPFGLATDHLGVFPHFRRPRVIWLGVTGDLAILNQLQAAVEHTIAPLGFPSEQRAFSPHLTLGRSFKDPSPAELTAIGEAVRRARAPQPVSFAVRSIVLMRSELQPTGARYTPVEHFTLGSHAARGGS